MTGGRITINGREFAPGTYRNLHVGPGGEDLGPLDLGMGDVGRATPATGDLATKAAAWMRAAIARGDRQTAITAALVLWRSHDVLGCVCGAGPMRLEADRPSWAWRHALAGYRWTCPCGLAWSLTGHLDGRKTTITLLGGEQDLAAQVVADELHSALLRCEVDREWALLLGIEQRHQVWELLCERERVAGCAPRDLVACSSPEMLDRGRDHLAAWAQRRKKTRLRQIARAHGHELPESARWWTRADDRVAIAWG